MKIIKNSTNNCWITTIAIGDKYFSDWENFALPTWNSYCDMYGLGLIVFTDDLIDRSHPSWKKATWQKLLIAETMMDNHITDGCVLYIDTDVLISPLAPNVFDTYDRNSIAVVSMVNNLPQPRDLTLRRLAYLRHTSSNGSYPLDSSLFMSPSEMLNFHGLPSRDDFFCAGFFVFDIKNHHKLMRTWFDNYDRSVQSITNGGDQTHVNHEMQSWGKIQWLPYEFQALWVYEIAWRYPFLFEEGKSNVDLVRSCIEASLYANYFLHFAGAWSECNMWKVGNFFASNATREALAGYSNYLKVPVTGKPVGVVRA